MKVAIKKAFTLTRDNGEQVHYSVGIHEMHEKDATHWFTKAHAGDPEAEEVKKPKAKAE